MEHVSGRLFVAAVVATAAVASTLAGTAAAVPPAVPPASCTANPYAYAGLFSNSPAQGITAVVTPLLVAHVPSGHVAGWIGVGGPNAGPGGKPEWLQTGLNTIAGGQSQLYAEIAQPGLAIKYVTLAATLKPGSSYRLAVEQLPGKTGVWQVLVNGKAATGKIYLPQSSNFAPMAMSESWNGGTPTCNGYSYRFTHLQINTNGGWQPLTNASTLTDTGYTIANRTTAGFTALSA